MADTHSSPSTPAKGAFFPKFGASFGFNFCLLGTGSKEAGKKSPAKNALELLLLCLPQVSDF
jgi:hypothetical protein